MYCKQPHEMRKIDSQGSVQIIGTSWRSLVQRTIDPSSETCLLQNSLTGPVPPLAAGNCTGSRQTPGARTSFSFDFGPTTDTDIVGIGSQHGQSERQNDKARPGFVQIGFANATSHGEHPESRDPDAVVGIRGDEVRVSVCRFKVKKWGAFFSSFRTV
jgi:hypothetical protein